MLWRTTLLGVLQEHPLDGEEQTCDHNQECDGRDQCIDLRAISGRRVWRQRCIYLQEHGTCVVSEEGGHLPVVLAQDWRVLCAGAHYGGGQDGSHLYDVLSQLP